MKIGKCPKCNSSNIGCNTKIQVWYCNDCGAIWYEYNQDLGGTIPKEKPDCSSNNNTPHLSSSDKIDNGES